MKISQGVCFLLTDAISFFIHSYYKRKITLSHFFFFDVHNYLFKLEIYEMKNYYDFFYFTCSEFCDQSCSVDITVK